MVFRASGGSHIRYSPWRFVDQVTVAWPGPKVFTETEAPGTASHGVRPPGPVVVLSRTIPPTTASMASTMVTGSTRVALAETLNSEVFPMNPAFGAGPAPPTGVTCTRSYVPG